MKTKEALLFLSTTFLVLSLGIIYVLKTDQEKLQKELKKCQNTKQDTVPEFKPFKNQIVKDTFIEEKILEETEPCKLLRQQYDFMQHQYQEVIREAKVISYLRETSKLKHPYKNDITEPSGIRYIGKYALSKDAILCAQNYWNKYHCENRSVWSMDALKNHEYPQELLMEDLLLYFIEECLKHKIKPTSHFIALCHWKGFNGALRTIQKGDLK